MEYVLAGVLGFLVGYLFDFTVFRPLRGLRATLWLVHSVLICYSTVMLCLASERYPVPAGAALLGAAILCVAAAFEVYSLFVNLPFRRTYLTDATLRPLVKTGTYALIRHPGVLWYFFILVGLILVTGSHLLALTLPLWVVLDVLWVVIQERFVFVRTIEGYAEYRRETPMLIPNARSIAACVRSVRWSAKEDAVA